MAETISKGKWIRAKHLDLLDRKLVQLASGEIKRLMVFMPPRHGKSQLCSKYFPAWYLGKFPDRNVILTSYEAGFAAEWGGRCRDLLTQFGQTLFGVQVSGASSARDDWKILGHDGGMVTAGVGGPITGRGANLFIVDDPVKNMKEANSETVRKSTWEWWTSTAFSRLEPDASVLIIMTRWNEDDLGGRLLNQDKLYREELGKAFGAEIDELDDDERAELDEQWHVIDFPAIAIDEEPDALGRTAGEALWPERWPMNKLLRRMRRLGTYVWNALYQQRPSPPEGNYFKKAWIRVIDPRSVPPGLRFVRNWDLAATAEDEAKDPDYLCGVKMAQDKWDNYFILDVYKDRVSEHHVEQVILSHAVMDGKDCAVRIEQEGAASGKIVAGRFERLLNGYDARFTGIPKGTKFVRSGAFNAACERGNVFLVAADWNDDYLDELAKFPYGNHDDQVDGSVGAYEALTDMPKIWTPDDVKKMVTYQYEN